MEWSFSSIIQFSAYFAGALVDSDGREDFISHYHTKLYIKPNIRGACPKFFILAFSYNNLVFGLIVGHVCIIGSNYTEITREIKQQGSMGIYRDRSNSASDQFLYYFLDRIDII